MFKLFTGKITFLQDHKPGICPTISVWLLIVFFVVFFNVSCKKFLDTKAVQTLATPTTLDDLEALLNNNSLPVGTKLLNAMSDEYYIDFVDWQSLEELDMQGYAWNPETNDYTDWSTQYRTVFYANTVLFNLDLLSDQDEEHRRNVINGNALFLRSLALFRIALLFAPQYDPATTDSDLGIPLILNADINQKSSRSTMQQTYEQLTSDLEQAVNMLPSSLPTNNISKTHPTKAAAHGLLARVYLQNGNYEKARDHAAACLSIYNSLMDFSDISVVDPASPTPFTKFNQEVIFYSMTDAATNVNYFAKIDSLLYRSYADDDLRKEAYYHNNGDDTYRFKGSYSGSFEELFNGIATDEIFLIRAESNARLGNTNDAMADLNHLLVTRWKKVNGTTTYVDQTATNATDALTKVLTERKKELIYRELRWADLKRLNTESAFASTLRRELNGAVILPPNDPRYALLIPLEVIRVTTLSQNPR
jgi:hypothetical protein